MARETAPTHSGPRRLGDPEAHYPLLPIPEFLLDCCTVGAEVRTERRLPAAAITNVGDGAQVHEAAKGEAVTFRAQQIADVVRLVVEPNIQVIVQEVDVQVSGTPLDNTHSHSWVPRGILWRHHLMTWQLRADQVNSLTHTWAQVALGPNADTIRLPLRRLGIATTRPFREDRLVDLWVALDGMFKREDEKRGGRVAQRIGQLLGADELEQRLLNRTLRRSYDVRNDVVHGRPDYTDGDVGHAIRTAEDALRRSLLALAAKQQRIDLTA